MSWDYEMVHDAACGSLCTVDGCPENHPSGYYAVGGPDWNDDALPYLDSEYDAALMAASPDLLRLLARVLDETHVAPGGVVFGSKFFFRTIHEIRAEVERIQAVPRPPEPEPQGWEEFDTDPILPPPEE